MTKNRFNNPPAIVSIVLSLFCFFLILAVLNYYQYSKVKNNIATANLEEISSIELIELRSFFEDVHNRLNVVREWGQNGLLQINDIEELNKKLFPLMNSQRNFTGILLADSSGTEYYLYRSDTEIVTRTSRVGKNDTKQKWQRWAKPDQVKEQWEEKSDYDPRKRPWFISPGQENTVSWTKMYKFFQSGKPGITASVSWIDPEFSDKYMVFGLDLLVEDIQKLLSVQQQKRNGIVFLINPEAGYTIESNYSSSRNLPLGGGGTSEQRNIVNLAIETWKAEGKPVKKNIIFTHDRQKWMSQFSLFGGDNNPIWVGVAASEKDMAAALKNLLFKVDMTDFVVAFAGGLLMLFLVWRLGMRHTVAQGTHKAFSGKLQEIILEGEGAHLEFKATVRHNINTDKPGKEIELAWLKAVVAFMNSGGGILLLGITDDGTVTGIEHDKFENDDRCLLHVKNLLNQHIGAEFSRLLNVHLILHEGCKVAAIECKSSPAPVFLKVGKNEDFFVRSGPSNTKLSPSQIISYLKKNRS